MMTLRSETDLRLWASLRHVSRMRTEGTQLAAVNRSHFVANTSDVGLEFFTLLRQIRMFCLKHFAFCEKFYRFMSWNFLRFIRNAQVFR